MVLEKLTILYYILLSIAHTCTCILLQFQSEIRKEMHACNFTFRDYWSHEKKSSIFICCLDFFFFLCFLFFLFARRYSIFCFNLILWNWLNFYFVLQHWNLIWFKTLHHVPTFSEPISKCNHWRDLLNASPFGPQDGSHPTARHSAASTRCWRRIQSRRRQNR